MGRPRNLVKNQLVSFTTSPTIVAYLKEEATKSHQSVSSYLNMLLWTGYECHRIAAETSASERQEVKDIVSRSIENNAKEATVDEIIERWVQEGKIKRYPDGKLGF